MTQTSTIELGKSGVSVSTLGIGTWAWGDSLYWGFGKGYDENDLQQAFDETLRDGINFFDTAEIYGFGKSEQFIGTFKNESPFGDTVRIATKFAPLPWRLTRGQVVSALRASLKRLQVETVDLYQIHFHVPWVSVETLMDGLAETVDKKMTRAVGVSNYNAAQVRRAHKRLASHSVPLASNQIEYSLLQRAPDFNGVIETCRELGVTVIAYSPLKYGVLTGKYDPTHPLPGARGRQFNSAYLARVHPLLTELRATAAKYNRTLPQAAVNWAMQMGTLPIPGAKNLKQSRENAGALGWVMDAADVQRLDAISKQVTKP